MSGTRTSLTGWLARMGFTDVARAQRQITELGVAADDPLLAAVAQAADPDLALAGLTQVAERAAGQAAHAGHAGHAAHAAHAPASFIGELRDDPAFRTRLIAVLGVSKALADHLARHPEDRGVLRGPDAARRPGAGEIRAELLRAVAADPNADEPTAGTGQPETGPNPDPRNYKTDPAQPLAAAYRRRVLHLAARDLTGAATVDEVGEELADIAAAVLEAALAVARAELPPGGAPCRLAVIAMGKCGARELNYASDVDVIFVAEPAEPPGRAGEGGEGRAGTDEDALKTATRLASGLIQVCERSTPEGSIFPVDPNLRPEGRHGQLVRTLASHQAYYDRWAKTWEFQALLKARPVAGDMALGEKYVRAITPLVWQASQRENFVEDVQAMRRRVVSTLPKNMAGRELKLGPGGLRDIEFAVQLLQLVHGRTDERLRVPATLPALAALAGGGYVGRSDADDLAAAYRFLRQTEHLLQLFQLRRTHTLPEDPAVLRRLGRTMSLSVIPNGPVLPPGEVFTQAWRRHVRLVRRLHEKLFYRPLLEAVARLPTEAARLTPEEARARLEALGYADPAGALRHIEALTTGVRRRAAIQRTLLPVLLGWFADAAEPDAGLLAFRQVSEALGETPWFLRLLRDETKAAERIAYVLASSRYATGLLLRAPEAVAIFADDAELVPQGAGLLRSEMMAAARRHEADAEQVAVAVRSLRRRELLRVAAADVLGLAGPPGPGRQEGLAGPGRQEGPAGLGQQERLAQTGEALTAITTASLEAVLAATISKIEMELRGPLPTRFAVIAMGRYGGHECGYGSDADVIFVHDPLPGLDSDGDRAASDAAQAVGSELRRVLQIPAPDPPLLVDADLRPEGRQGPLVRSLAACRAYYERRASPWEHQALLRAEFAVGDAKLGAEFMALADLYRYPDGGIGEQSVREIRRIKARVEAERIPRGADRALHLKLGPGGLSDVEWTVQLLQLRHGFAVPELRTTSTLGALDAAVGAGLVTAADAAALSASWQLAARIRNAIMLVRGRPGDTLPARHDELTAIARLLGYRGSAAPAAGSGGLSGPGSPGTGTLGNGFGHEGAGLGGTAAGGPAAWGDTPAQALEQDYRRTARHARTVMDRLFYG